jgi:2-methylcitrate dehydratase PrpD
VDVLQSGIWPSLAVAPVTAAAVMGVMRRLDAHALENALRIALLRSIVRAGHATAKNARWYLFGAAVRDGIDAVTAAQAGLQVDERAPFPFMLDAKSAEAPIGAGSLIEISQKPFCTARQSLSGVDAFIALLGSGIRHDNISSVRVTVPRAYAWMIENDARAGDRLSAVVSQRFQIAVAALDRDVLYDIERAGPFAPAIAAFAQRVTVEPSDDFDDRYPRLWPARVTIVLSDGSERTCTIDDPHGGPRSPLTFVDLQRKSPRYSAHLHQLCLNASDDGPSELIIALAALPEAS